MNARRLGAILAVIPCGFAGALLAHCGSSTTTGGAADASADVPHFGFDSGQLGDSSHPALDGTSTLDGTGHMDVASHMDGHVGQMDVGGGGHDTGTHMDTGGGGHDTGGGGSLFPAGTICNSSGTKLTPPATVKHVIVILEENEDFSNVNGAAPYITALAGGCGSATQYIDNTFKENLVSCPHYLALASGSNCNTGVDEAGGGCITSDGDASGQTLDTPSIFSQVSSWKAYMESMPSNCDLSSSGLYATKHNPPAYYSTLTNCSTNDIGIAPVTCDSSAPMTACSSPSNAFTDDIANDTLPALSFISPNLDNDMHNGTVTQGDNWLFTYMPLILASKEYLAGEVAVLVLWDEQSTSTFGGPIPNLVVSPYITAGTVVATTMNHFAALRAMENALGITTYLGCASGSISGGGSCATGSTTDLRAAFNF